MHPPGLRPLQFPSQTPVHWGVCFPPMPHSTHKSPRLPAPPGSATCSAQGSLSRRCSAVTDVNQRVSPTMCKPLWGTHCSLFTSSELIGGNAEQHWLRESWEWTPPGQCLCAWDLFTAFITCLRGARAHLDPITIMKGAGFMLAPKPGTDFTTSLEKQEASKYFLFHL